jgi:DNA-directed RNA polymerase subunit RPC12/RpoP
MGKFGKPEGEGTPPASGQGESRPIYFCSECGAEGTSDWCSRCDREMRPKNEKGNQP